MLKQHQSSDFDCPLGLGVNPGYGAQTGVRERQGKEVRPERLTVRAGSHRVSTGAGQGDLMIRRLVAAVCFAGLLVGCSQSPQEVPGNMETAGTVEPDAAPARDKSTCFNEGVAYYKAIGSYPTLSTGKPADDLIIEKCGFNPDMFKDMPL